MQLAIFTPRRLNSSTFADAVLAIADNARTSAPQASQDAVFRD